MGREGCEGCQARVNEEENEGVTKNEQREERVRERVRKM